MCCWSRSEYTERAKKVGGRDGRKEEGRKEELSFRSWS